MNFKDIKQAVRDSSYRVNVSWKYLEDQLASWTSRDYCPFELEPDFQRGHVWNDEQRSRYVEAKLEGRVPHDTIRFNCRGWMGNFEGPFQCVDGLQRITAARLFMADKVRAFGLLYSEFEGRLPSDVDFIFTVNSLRTREEVLTWYIQLNTGGTPHSAEEIARVNALREACKK